MKKYSIFIALCAIFFIVLSDNGNTVSMAADVSDYYREKLEFASDGTLQMTTHDKKATSEVTYRTLGWIIKRYDAPLTAKGQKYAVIKLRSCSDIQNRNDPKDRAYMYCYYYGDKTEIYNAIGNASNGWQRQLYNYGDTVYIDEVMTVCVKGIPLGTLTGNSSNCVISTGEVYTSYSGIAGARPWASKASLLTHFDKKVKYPAMVQPPKLEVIENPVDTMLDFKSTAPMGTIGHDDPGVEKYNVTCGVPCLEQLYATVRAEPAIYDIEYTRYLGTGYLPVKVVTTYHYKWKDLKGVNRTEDVTVTRWYRVKRSFSYWRIANVKYAYLESAQIKNGAFELGKCDMTGRSSPAISTRKKTGYADHISLSKYTRTVYNDGGTVKGKDGLRPSVPNDNFSELAESAVGIYKVKNDYLKIGSSVLLSGDTVNTRGTNPVKINSSATNLQNSNITIPASRGNGSYPSSGSVCYRYNDGTAANVPIEFINDVCVYTPIVCDINLCSTGDMNQEINPYDVERTVVIGSGFTLDMTARGMHSELQGYGYRDYSKYLRKSQVKFECNVKHNGVAYNAGTWIDVVPNQNFIVPAGTPEGEYKVVCRNYAINSSADREKIIMPYANTIIQSYTAESELYMRVIGSIYDCRVDKGDEKIYTVGDKDYMGRNNGSENVMPMEVTPGRDDITFRITTVGDYGGEDSEVQIRITCRINEDGNKVCLYKKEGDNYIKINEELWAVRTANNAGKQKWETKLSLSGDICVIYDGVYGDEITEEEARYSELPKDNLIINADIYTYRYGVAELTYMNGLCNMWQREGFNDRNIYMDGDCLLTKLRNITKNEYNVVGTH